MLLLRFDRQYWNRLRYPKQEYSRLLRWQVHDRSRQNQCRKPIRLHQSSIGCFLRIDPFSCIYPPVQGQLIVRFRSQLAVLLLFAAFLHSQTCVPTSLPSILVVLLILLAILLWLNLPKPRDESVPLEAYHNQIQHYLPIKNLTMQALDHIHLSYKEKQEKHRPK